MSTDVEECPDAQNVHVALGHRLDPDLKALFTTREKSMRIDSEYCPPVKAFCDGKKEKKLSPTGYYSSIR